MTTTGIGSCGALGPLDIAIVGAGISGLTAALSLAGEGHRVQVYEAAPEWGEVGAGITLSPNAMRGLDFVGVGAEVLVLGTEPDTQVISHWQDGRALLTVDRRGTSDKYGSAYVYIHRADLHNILVRAAQDTGVRLRLGKRASRVDVAKTGACICFDDRTEEFADLVIGADGLKSSLRNLFDPQPAHFTGHIAYRALAPAGPDIQAMIDQPGMHIGPGKMVVRYPLRQGSLLNLVFFTRQKGWAEDGWSIAADVGEVSHIYEGWCDDVLRMIDAIDTGSVYKWAINAHEPLTRGWSHAGRVTLIGDAAHAMTPFLGQGAATGIEDAVVLARALRAADSLEDALERYYRCRFERTAFIQLESNLNADRLQGDEADQYGVGNLRNEETLGLFWYDCAAETV